MNILIVLVALGLGFWLGRGSKSGGLGSATEAELGERREASRKALSERTAERKERILEMMRQSRERHEELKMCGLPEERRGISRRDVEELLGVAEDTALKYLNELEEEGKIRQIGNIGRGVFYMIVS